MRPVKIILLLLAFGMLMTHAVVPHTHFSDQKQSSLQQKKPFALKNIFSVNLGPEHLKTFKDGDAVKPAAVHNLASAIPPIPDFSFSVSFEKPLILPGVCEACCSPNHKSVILRRGPPAI